jgi:hypothetical protein
MLSRSRTATFAILTLLFCVNTVDETLSALERFTNAANFDNVYTDGNNH